MTLPRGYHWLAMATGKRLTSSRAAAEIEAAMRRQAENHARLSAADEARLLERADPEAATSLVEHNLDLVVDQAERHRDRGLTFADLYQEGAVGLLDAVSAYQGQGDFRGFASLHIGLQMDSLVEAEAEARREAERYVSDSRALDLATAAFRQQNRRPPSEPEIAALLDWDVDHLRRVSDVLQRAREESDAALIDFLDENDSDELGIDFPGGESEDHRRRPAGAGPDD
ncbi:MAG: polymerase nonessential primary-like sigma factor [Chloroflexota bacterium]|jgi:RNA polymerase primary sigma factor|nr:polymerase nonessential primary-like sigma factor [Chloroflexota bacterium]